MGGVKENCMDKLPEEALVILFSYLPNFRDLVCCSMVCKRWRTILDSGSAVWKHALDSEVPASFVSDKLIQPLESPKAKLMAYLCAWSDSDRSKNIEIKQNRLTLLRRPIAQSTDAVRGKRGFSYGQHYWIIIWHGPSFGSNAVVGVATKMCPLHGEGYYSLLGSDSESWGWDLSKKCLKHSGEKLADYPRVGGVEVQLHQKIGVHLDMTHRTLAFDINGKYFGVAFRDLPAGPLFPAISSVYGNSEISLVYLGLPLVG